jgi:hypothetical protein
MKGTPCIHHLSPRADTIRGIRTLRLVNPLHTYKQVIEEWHYITTFMSNAFRIMRKQRIVNNILIPQLNMSALHIRTEKQLGIYQTVDYIKTMTPEQQHIVNDEIKRRRIRAYTTLLRITSTSEFSR